MITLRKRLSVHDRVGKVTVIDMLNDPAGNNITYYLIKVFGKDRYLYICQQCESLNQYWIAVDEDRADYYIYKSFLDIIDDYKTFAMFTKQDRSSFKYWFAHWCGFQLTALNLGIWKPKYLLHDIEKPWLKLLWRGDYKKVQKWHRTHNKHHLEYGLEHGWDAIDWEALMIDWECCSLSKQEAQLDARETLEYEIQREKWKPYATDISNCLLPILNKYNM
jgi:hypothetical protein